MFEKIYLWLRKSSSCPKLSDEYSAGYWQERVRGKVLQLSKGAQGRFLEVGCGEGLFLSRLTEDVTGLEIWGIDNDIARLKSAESRCKGLGSNPLNFLLQEATQLNFENEFFDTVVCINVLYNMDSIDSVKTALGEMSRVCKRTGRIIFDFRNSLNPFLKIKYRFARYYDKSVKDLPLRTYSPGEIKSILEKLQLNIIGMSGVGFFFTLLAPVIIVDVKKL